MIQLLYALPAIGIIALVVYVIIFFSKIKNLFTQKYECPDGYELEGLRCIPNPPDGYKRLKGDYSTYWRKNPETYAIEAKDPKQDNSACNDLKSVVKGINTCTGTVPLKCTGCGCIKYTKNKKTRKCGKSCPSGYKKTGIACGVIGSCVKDCEGGLRDDGTSCWEDRKCTGGEIVTRKAPRSCPPGLSFDKADIANVGRCYGCSREHYEKRAGDIISCWNTKPLSIIIDPKRVKNATPKE